MENVASEHPHVYIVTEKLNHDDDDSDNYTDKATREVPVIKSGDGTFYFDVELDDDGEHDTMFCVAYEEGFSSDTLLLPNEMFRKNSIVNLYDQMSGDAGSCQATHHLKVVGL